MNDQGQLDIIDILSVASFYIGLLNLQENLTQGDKQDIQDDLSQKADYLLSEIHRHLEEQDVRLSRIEKLLEVNQNDNRRDFQGIVESHDQGHDDPRQDG